MKITPNSLLNLDDITLCRIGNKFLYKNQNVTNIPEKEPCDQVVNLANQFNNDVQHDGNVPYIDDYSGLFLFGIELLPIANKSYYNIIYYPDCNEWTLKLTV